MTDNNSEKKAGKAEVVSRRGFLAATVGVATIGCETKESAEAKITVAEQTAAERRSAAPKPPFDTLREYVAALEAHDLLLRFDSVDNEEFEVAIFLR